MASMIGVSSNLQALSLEVSRKVSFVAFQASVSPWLCYRVQLPPLVKSGCSCRLRRLQRVAAISTPNNVVNEKALKSLEFDEDLDSDFASDGVEDGDDGDDDYGSDAFEQKGSDDENLAISRLDLDSSIVEALNRRGITHLFPIQRAVLVPALEGRDIIGRAKTGTGKTLAFGIPIVQKVMEENKRAGPFIQRRSRRLPRVLVLAPTRELAKQVEKEFKESAPSLSTVCIYGGVSYATQQNALSRGVDVVVGTPGRIIDLVESKSLLLSEVQFLVLDEADQMLAVGFEEPVEIILEQLSAERQSMLFSATMPGWVQKLARKYLNDPLTIDLVGDADDKLPEGIKLYAVSTAPSISSKRSILGDLITVYAKGGKSIVFTRTKRDADDVATALSKELTCEALHGDISQYQRERTLSKFREGKFLTLVATDVAARGLDIPNVDLIIHYELPVDSEAFVHRSGRTGRAGKEGVAILMYTTSQRRKLKFLENDVSCKFEFVHPPQPKEVLQSSSQHVAKTLEGVHPELINMFLPTAEKLLEQEGNNVMAAALACLSGFSQPPSSRSLLTLEKGWTTLQIAKDSTNIMTGRAFTPRDARGVLSSIWPVAADQVGKIKMITDRKVQGAVFDLPEDVARDLLKKQSVPGFSISEISQLPELEEEDEYFRGRERGGSLQGFRGRGGSLQGFRGRGGGRSSSGRGRSRFGGNSYFDDSDDDDDDWPVARKSRQSGYDDGRKSSRSSFGSSNDRNFRGACYRCGKTGHKAADCPSC